MKCPSCGKDIPSDSNFCPFCGNIVVSLSQQRTSVIIIYSDGEGCSITNGENHFRIMNGKNVISENLFPWIKNGFFFEDGEDAEVGEIIKSVDLSGFDSSKVTSMCLMFDDCSSIESIDFDNFDSSNVVDMNCTFFNCSSLKTLDLSKFDTSKVVDMGQMFEGCSSLESLNLSNFNTNNIENMNCMFDDCNSLKQVILKNCDSRTIRMISGAISEAGIVPEIITN